MSWDALHDCHYRDAWTAVFDALLRHNPLFLDQHSGTGLQKAVAEIRRLQSLEEALRDAQADRGKQP